MAHEVPISGHVDPKGFPFLLMDLHRNGATGSLKVDGPTYQKALYFRGGRILFASSNDPRDQLGAILIEGGKITPEQLEDINTKVGPGSPLAKVLADSGFVSQRELSEAARAKVEQILCDVVGYTTGSFEFEDGVLPKGAVDLKLSSEQLVLAAVRRVSDRAFVLRHLGSLEVVLAPAPDPRSLLAEIQEDLGGLMDVLDGRATLKEAAAQTRLDEFEAAKIACALLFLNLAERVAPNEEVTPFFVAPQASPQPDVNRTVELAVGEPAPERTLVDEPLADPASFALVPEAPTVIVRAPTPEPAKATPPPEPEPEPIPEPAPTLIASASTVITPAPAAPRAQLDADDQSRSPPTPKPVEPREPRRTIEPRRAPRASAADMAAVDALLSSRSFEGPLEPLEKHPEPRFLQPRSSPGGRGPGTSASGSRPILLGAGLLLVVAAVGGGAWFFLLRPRGLTPVAVRTPPPAAVTAPPSTTLSPVTPTTLSETPTPATTVPAAQETPPPKPSPKAPTARGAKSLEDARALMGRGDLAEAAAGFAGHVRGRREAFTIQILVACSDDTVQKALANSSAPELYILPVHYKGKSCYRLCWGIFDDEGRAGSAMGAVPGYFRQGGASPKVVRTSAILP